MTRDTTTPAGDNTPRRTLSLKRDTAPAVRIEERLHKVLAQAGLGSRRALEERIAGGQVKVNGEIAQVGSSLKTGDRVEVDGKVFVASALTDAPRVLIYHKPEGEVTTREDPEGRPTVFEKLPPLKGSRWIAVGRLDINTTGLLLLTTDGDLANALMHPSSEVRREYVCRIHGEVSDEHIEQLSRGVQLDDGTAKFDRIERIGSSDSHAWFGVALHEGRNREVRRMWEALGFQVSRLKRVRYGSIELPRLLKRGHWEDVPAAEVEALKASVNLPVTAPVLTLQPVIGQRRAKASEYRPEPREQRAWTGTGYADEGRELRAFDNLREDRPARPGGGKGRPGGKPGGRYGKTGGAPGRPAGGARAGGPRGNGGPSRGNSGPRGGGFGAGQAHIPDDIGNRIGGKPTHAGHRRSGPGYDNPAEHRSWYVPEGVTTGSRVAPPRGQGRPAYGGTGRPTPGARTDGHPGGGRPGGPGGKSGGRAGASRPGGGSQGKGRPGGPPGNNPYRGPNAGGRADGGGARPGGKPRQQRPKGPTGNR
ncbi:23S rRNA pseudouridine(2605) synthase RluB [Chiayiivirga flava]|uniref:Pseudouridine synthase n=1 Tax=Chiayiivirga flava TaxID=659595 RepID=A0A7W8D7U2_9GAMM|nr:pseudouridine synthase [Chiayiivirga flava]MBB5208337.1 23S rRNA pseudouridine2605 synthase [Chiayiivirga flava]